MLWHQIQIERLVSHYRQLDCWGMYVTAGGAPHLRFPVRIIEALCEMHLCRTKGCDKTQIYTALLNHLVAEGPRDRNGTKTLAATRREDGNIQSTKSWVTRDR